MKSIGPNIVFNEKCVIYLQVLCNLWLPKTEFMVFSYNDLASEISLGNLHTSTMRMPGLSLPSLDAAPLELIYGKKQRERKKDRGDLEKMQNKADKKKHPHNSCQINLHD